MKNPVFRLTLAVLAMFGAVACGPVDDEIGPPPADDPSVEFSAPESNNVEAEAVVASCSSGDRRKSCYCPGGSYCWHTATDCGCSAIP